ncbi:MAG: prepilin-type N-terminal cleavage/methylation domain-containing protein [Bacilli bacterium]|nr:prepilin-type N-terminal cleavage/methylation domain-containing protein [Bacilli bacterium]
MRKNNRGFTLIELLAVIVILALLMMIAIPSVTRYITQSRVKTVTKTMDSYITAVVQEVNDGDYHFSDSTKIYAIPIECVSLEKGGTSPFGEWMQANDAYWAYVLVQYDNVNYNYKYGFTFKDSAGYGMYPTVSANIDEKSNQVKTGYDDLTKPESGKAVEFVPSEKWNGFTITDEIELIVLESASEGEEGNGETTCTLCQKGDNYEQVESEKDKVDDKEKEEENPLNENMLSNLIRKNNPVITATPTLTTTSNNTSDASGLYSSTATTNGQPTYYFRGNVTNNYVSFANQTWRIIRINEDGTVRIMLNSGVNNQKYIFNSTHNKIDDMYYSNSDTAKPTVDSWYKTNIKDKGFDGYVVLSNFCEQAKVKGASYSTTGNASMTVFSEYTPNFKCATDGNGKGILSSKVALITYDEVVFAGGYSDLTNDKYYIYNGGYYIWTMSPAGVLYGSSQEWRIESSGKLNDMYVISDLRLRPVINLRADITATGTGISSDPYVVQVN